MAKNTFYPQEEQNIICSNSIIFWMINIKFGRYIHWHGKNVHVYFQVPIFRIFGLMAKNTFLQFYMHISYTNRPIDMKFGMLVHCNNMYTYVNFQLHNCYIFSRIAKNALFL